MVVLVSFQLTLAKSWTSKSCHSFVECAAKKNGLHLPTAVEHKHTCTNYNGTTGNMKPVGVYHIFKRSKDLRMLRYIDYYVDDDCKAYDAVKDIYGEASVQKLECIGHIQKRVRIRLRKLKSTQKGLGGKGKLTDNFIDKLQNYGIAAFEAMLVT